jgi:transposase
MNVFLAKLIMYYEIHRMYREEHSISQISEYLVLNRRTVTKYLNMSEQKYEEFLFSQGNRKKSLAPYEDFVKAKLEQYPDTPAAQMHDWLKEYHSDFPKTSQKTVFNFVHWVRDKYNIPKEKATRQYHPIEELAYGKQAQVDFGEYNMRTTLGNRIKVFFFVLVLSRSRYKYIWFIDKHFTAELAIQAHELAFEYISGVPDEVVYDQDKVFVVSENGGDIILTDAFKAYTREKSFSLHFCRKADPESKGKVENVVKYVKQNFLYNRTFYSLETLNDEVKGWMGRTANMLPHSFTKKEPDSEWYIEKAFLKPHVAYKPKSTPPTTYTVRQDNSISYKSNLYSLPLGTYKGRDTRVAIKLVENKLIIMKSESHEEICTHSIAQGKGQKILNNDHKRDKSAAINELIEEVAGKMPDPQMAQEWLNMIRKDKPRYIRDQLLMIRDAQQGLNPELVSKVLQYCITNRILNATDFKAIVGHYLQESEPVKTSETKIIPLNPLGGKIPDEAYRKPETSSLNDYQDIINSNI